MSDTESEQSEQHKPSPDWLVPDVVEIFEQAVPNYEECKNAKQRGTVIKDIKSNIVTTLDDAGIECPKDLTQIIVDYLTKHAVLENNVQLGPAGLSQRRWTARQVFVSLHKTEIRLACDKLAGTTERQDKSWLAKYQPAAKELYDALEEDEIEELQQTATEWSQYGPSDEVKLESFKKFAARDVESFIQLMSKSYGACVVMMVVHREDDRIILHKQATAPGYEGLSPAWNLPALASPAVAGAIQEWAEKQYYQPDDDENQVELRQVAGNARYQEVGLDKGNHGHYIIGNHMWLEWQPKLQNLLVQSLVRQEYCLLKKNPRARTPWKQLAHEAYKLDDERELITSEYAPENWAWSDPHKLKKGDAAKLLTHWAQREADGLPAVVFKGCEVIQRKKKAAYVEVDEETTKPHRPKGRTKKAKSNQASQPAAKRRKTLKHIQATRSREDSDDDDIGHTAPPMHQRSACPRPSARKRIVLSSSSESSEHESSLPLPSETEKSTFPDDEMDMDMAVPDSPSNREEMDEDMSKHGTDEELDQLDEDNQGAEKAEEGVEGEDMDTEEPAQEGVGRAASEKTENEKAEELARKRREEEEKARKRKEEEEEEEKARKRKEEEEKARKDKEKEREKSNKAAKRSPMEVQGVGAQVPRRKEKAETATEGSSTMAAKKNNPACVECHKGKVGCDRLLPQCSRCTKKQRTCAYPLVTKSVDRPAKSLKPSASKAPVYTSAGPASPEPSTPIFAELLAKIFPASLIPTPERPRLPEILKILGDKLDFVRNAMWDDTSMENDMPIPEAFEFHPEEPLPVKFHSESAVLEFLRWFQNQPFVTDNHPQYLVKSEDWKRVLTGLARAYRDVLIVNELEPDTEIAPIYQTSPINHSHMDAFRQTTADILEFISDSKFSPPSGAPI